MHLTTIGNQFQFNLPTDFLPDGLEAKYEPWLRKNHSPYTTVLDYINATIKSITFPGLDFAITEQTKKRGIKHQWKAAENIYMTTAREATIQFRSVDGHANYLIMVDALQSARLDVLRRQNDPDMFLYITDWHKDVMMQVCFRSVIMKSLSDCKFAYADTVGENKDFTLSFVYNYLDIGFALDRTDITRDEADNRILAAGSLPAIRLPNDPDQDANTIIRV